MLECTCRVKYLVLHTTQSVYSNEYSKVVSVLSLSSRERVDRVSEAKRAEHG